MGSALRTRQGNAGGERNRQGNGGRRAGVRLRVQHQGLTVHWFPRPSHIHEMKVEYDVRYAETTGSNCSVSEIAEALMRLRASSFHERYDVYAELFREDWATNAGYVLLPGLSGSLDGTVDAVGLEVAFVVGSIQISVLKDRGLGEFEPIVAPCVIPSCLSKTIQHLKKGASFCGPNLPAEQCEALIAALQSQATPDALPSVPRD